MKKSIILLGIILIIGLLFLESEKVLGNLSQPRSSISEREVVVTLSENGFEPQEITVKKGEVVRFVATVERPFWPASDLHPTHQTYSEFDPKEPIDSKSSWSFQFARAGTWRYHDHLYPAYRGSVVVQQ